MRHTCKVSVIVTAHNYGKYVCQAVDSVLAQLFNQPFEVVVVNDGSTDDTERVLSKFDGDPRVRIFTTGGLGLAAACNYGIDKAGGEYLIRLDADDYFDENILLVLTNVLDRRPEVGMVYPDYYLVDRYGRVMEHIRLQKVHDEVKLLDRSALAAGAMYRRTCFDALGGYDERLTYQEDYDFWLRFTEKFNVINVNLPLMYYRKHGKSMSTNLAPRMRARRFVKSKIAGNKNASPEIVAIIPAKECDWEGKTLALETIGGKPALYYSLESALNAEGVSRVIVSTDSPEVAELAEKMGASVPFLRPKNLCREGVSLEDVSRDLLGRLMREEGRLPDHVMILPVCSPFRNSEHVKEAVSTMIIHDPDTVISVVRDISFHWKPGEEGLTPLIYKRRLLRQDKESIYKENGAIYLHKARNILGSDVFGKRVCHIEMLPEESLQIRDNFSMWLCRSLIGSEFLGADR